jgi:DcaP outer membrane protein
MKLSKLFATGLAVAALAIPAAGSAQAAKPGEFKIPGTETTLKLNGFVELDATYDFSGADDDIRGNDWASFLEFQPLDKGERQKRKLYLTTKTSRVGLTTTTPTAWGALNVRVEGDFNSPSPFNFSSEATTNGSTFRMRHTYGEIGGLLIGQTWGNFNDLGSFPDTVDFNGHGAFGASRRPMIKYTAPVGTGSLAVSLENPQSVVSGSVYPASATVGRYYDRYPDVVANFTMPLSFGHVSLRGVGLEYNGTNATGVEDSKWGYALAASGSVKLGADTFVWGVAGGDGMGIHNFQTLFQGAAFVGNEIKTWKAVSYHAGYTHAWSDTVRSNLIWTQTFIENDRDLTAAGVFGAPTLVNKRVDAGYLNTFIAPVKNVEFGLEYSYGQRIIPAAAAAAPVAAGGAGDASNDVGTQHRVNALARYSFF